jgi:probable HAF family extracellular repeat protein
MLEETMSLPRLAAFSTLAIFVFSTFTHAAETASCTFNTFAAPPGYTFNEIEGIGDDGAVVGQLIDNKTYDMVGFSYSSNGKFTLYTVPKSMTTWLYGLNAVGTDAGSYQDLAYPQHIHGFLLQNGNVTDVNYPKAANSWVFNVNKTGGVVGSFSASASEIKGFYESNGDYTPIAYNNAQITYPMAVNDNGAVVGIATSGLVSNGFLWQNGKFTTIDYAGAKYGTGLVGINNSGVIVGNHYSGDRIFGFIYENGAFKNIVYSGAHFTMTGGINDNGVISGQIYFTETNTLGFTATCQ